MSQPEKAPAFRRGEHVTAGVLAAKAAPGTVERCPVCKSHAIHVIPDAFREFYASTIVGCRNCRALWEPLPPGEPRCPEEPLLAFLEPCSNCAFRPGSPEQEDREEWRKKVAELRAGNQFFCHKGVPIDPNSENGFLYPATQDGKKIDKNKMRLCRGYLNMVGKIWDKEFPVKEVADENSTE